MSGWVHPVNKKWKLVSEPNNGTFETNDLELNTDVIIFSTGGQIQQLEEIKIQVDRLISQLKAVNSWVSGVDYDSQGGEL